MGFAELFLLAVGLSADAFAVSICKGVCQSRASLGKMAVVGAWFGAFQALMPMLGFFLGTAFRDYITAFDHWIAFVLLGFIGGKMIWDSFGPPEGGDCSLKAWDMFLAAVATSIDALAVGVTFSMLLDTAEMFGAIGLIGVTTFILSAIGVKIGSVFGDKFSGKAQLLGGVILVLIGLKILLEHLGVILF